MFRSASTFTNCQLIAKIQVFLRDNLSKFSQHKLFIFQGPKITQPPAEHCQVDSPNLLLHRSFPAVRNCIHCYAKSSLCCDANNKIVCAPAWHTDTHATKEKIF